MTPTVLVALVLWLVGGGMAHAGGPTSVLATNYTDGLAGAAIYSSEVYQGLVAELDVTEVSGGTAGSSQVEAPEGIDESEGADIRLTWYLHDVTAWRLDGIYEVGQDIWISTATMLDDGNLHEVKPMWHKAEHPKKLRSLLIELGVMVGDIDVTSTQTSSHTTTTTTAGVATTGTGQFETPATGSAGDSSSGGASASTLGIAGATGLIALVLGFFGGRVRTSRGVLPDAVAG